MARFGRFDHLLATLRQMTEAEIPGWMTRLSFYENPLPMAVIDPQTLRYLACNDAAERSSGFTRDQMCTMTLWDVRSVADADALLRAWMEHPDEPVQYRSNLRTAAGPPYPAVAITVPVEFKGKTARLSVAVNEPALERAESVQLRLTRQMAIAAAAERVKLAGDLHDGPIQDLSVAVMRLRAVRKQHPELHAVTKAVELVIQAITSLRETMAELDPPGLARGSLREILANVQSKARERDEIDLIVDMNADLRVPEHIAVCVHRIVLEAVANVRKHAETTELSCSIRLSPIGLSSIGLSLVIIDEGKGFDTGAPSSGRGLDMMRNRAEVLGGTFTVHSSEAGTRVEILLPCGPAPATGQPHNN